MQTSYRFRQWLADLITLSLTVLPPPASAVFGVGDIVYDPANYSQNVLTAVRALQSNLNEATQIANQLRQIEMEVKNLASFPAETWQTVQADLDQLKQLAQSSGDIGTAMQTLSVQFNQMYPGYKAPANYEQEYKTWTDNTLDMINKAAGITWKQYEKLPVESSRTQRIATSAATAEGQMQALQTGNMLTVQLVDQLQSLRQLQMMEMNAQNAYMATQIQNQADEKAAIKKWLDRSKNFKPFM